MPARWPSAALVLLLLLILAAYAPLAMAGWVFDDTTLIVDNTLTGSLANLPAFFATDLWESAGVRAQSGYYRPLMLLSLAVDRSLWGLAPGPAHLHSLAWHLAATGALYALLRQHLGTGASLAGTAIFGLHPVQSEAVAWVASRNDSMSAALLLGGLAAAVPPQAPGLARAAAGGLLALAALLSKENAVIALPALLLLELAVAGRPRGWAPYLAFFAATAVAVALRTAAGVEPQALATAEQLALWGHRIPAALAWYGRLLFWPWPLSPGVTLEYLELPPAQVAAGLTAPILLAFGALHRGGRLAGAGLIIAAGSLAPVLLILANRGQVGERYLYLPMAGIALAAAAALDRMPARSPLLLLPAAPAALLVLHLRLPEWHDGLSLWAAAYRDHPNGYTAASLAHEYNLAGLPAPAAELFHEALRDEPPYLDACRGAVRAPVRAGLPHLAVSGVVLAEKSGCPRDLEALGDRVLALATARMWPDIEARLAGRSFENPQVWLAESAARHARGDTSVPSRYTEADPDFVSKLELLVHP